MPAVLGYWDIRGLAQPARLLLHYVGQEFEDKRYETGPAPDFNKDSWNNEKFSLELPFPNLPYFKDGDSKIVQSNAIMRSIARKHNLCGTTEDEMVKCDIMENQSMDFRNGFVRLCYSPDYETLRPEYLKSLPATLKLLSDFLGENPWFAGKNLTFVDFIMYELLDQHRMFEPTCLDDHKNMRDFLDRFEALPAIKKYMKSEQFSKWPVNNKMAKWGGN
ncbi:glutathione S-transferase Mu 1 [Lingula anatina]|uniref:glutathione transferase n=1 Tax=Lingula anatina TaxID=7574 RepID=A0A2R2MNC7_LINAN|nr:glutathione S-transferase Mu 1 [Lingula anatina]|eukprot:XP_023931567.1 glutathione S-transferase Mu 1 [Lingula anatina]